MSFKIKDFPFCFIPFVLIFVLGLIFFDLFFKQIILIYFKVIPLEVHDDKVGNKLQVKKSNKDKSNPSRLFYIINEQNASINKC